MNSRIRRCFNILFAVFVFLYLIIEFPYGIEVIFVLSSIISIDILYKSTQYRIRRNHLIELGEEETFHHRYIGILLLIVFIITLIYGIPKLIDWEILPKRKEGYNDNFSMIVLMPQLIRFFIGIIFKEMGQFFYATDNGILTSMEVEESYNWEGFNSYKIIDDQKLLRFEKKNLKYLFISYEEKYFNKHREEILTILDKNLTRE